MGETVLQLNFVYKTGGGPDLAHELACPYFIPTAVWKPLMTFNTVFPLPEFYTLGVRNQAGNRIPLSSTKEMLVKELYF